MVDKIDPDTMRRIEQAVKDLAEMEYPEVWIGEPGMTAYELMTLQMVNDDMPEELRIEPGEFIQVEGDEEGRGLRMPEVGDNYLDGLWVYENMPHALLERDVLGDFESDMLHIYAAKQNKVAVTTVLEDGEDISWRRHREPLDGLVVLRHIDPYGDIIQGYTKVIRLVPVARLTPDDVSQDLEDLIDELEICAQSSSCKFVIDDSKEARDALEKRLNS
jgi:hypothetical protein